MFYRTKRPFFSTDPHEVCEGLLLLLLPQIIVKRAMKQISCRTRGATPSVPSIPARRIEPRMKRVVKPWENCDILGHHGRTLGSAGVSIYIYICVCVWGVDGCVGKNPFRTLDSVDMRVLSRHHGLLTYTKSWSNP